MSDANYVSREELMNDSDELVGYRPGADANSFRPPLVEGEYEAGFTFATNDANKRWAKKTTKKGELKTYYMAELKAMTEGNPNEDHNGYEFSRFASTLVMRGGTTGVQAVLQALGVEQSELDMSRTHGAQIKLIEDNVDGGNNIATIIVNLEASYYDATWVNPETGEAEGKEYFRLRGWKRFPMAKDPEKEPEYSKSIVLADGSRHYPWVDLDISDLDAVTIVQPDSLPTGGNIQRCFGRNYISGLVTKGASTASSASSGVSARPTAPAAAAPAVVPTAAPATTTAAPRPASTARAVPARR